MGSKALCGSVETDESLQVLRLRLLPVLHGLLFRDPLGGQGDGWLAGSLLTFSQVFADSVQVVAELLGMGIRGL
jgi:hypothetical protein